MIREAVILAGGFGTRLQSVVQDLPKPMAPVNGRPFLSYLIQYLSGYGISRVILSTGYLHDKIEGYFGHNYHGIEIQYSIESQPMGTGGGIRLALEKCTSEEVLVMNGDSFFEINLRSFYRQFHLSAGAIALSVRHVEVASRYGTLLTNADFRIIAFREKDGNHTPGDINAGVYIMNKQVFLSETPPAVPFSLEQDFFETNVDKLDFYGFPFEGYFIDIGIPEDYEKVKIDFASKP